MRITKKHNKTLELIVDGRCVLRLPKWRHKEFYAIARLRAFIELLPVCIERIRAAYILMLKTLREKAAAAIERIKEFNRHLLPAPQPRIVNGELQRRIDAPYRDKSRSPWEEKRASNERQSASLQPHPVEMAFRAALGGTDEDPNPELTKRCHELGVKSPYEIWRNSFANSFRDLGLKGATS